MKQRAYLIGVDIGTSSAKAVVVSDTGEIVAQHTAHYGLLTPQALWAEQWPDVWLEGMSEAVRGALECSKISPSSVQAMTVSSLYGGSGIPVDNDIRALRPCLIWMDRRATEEAAWVQQHIPSETLFEVTGNGADSYHGFTKMLWLKRNEPDVWRRTRYFLPPNAYLIQRLTGSIAVDHSSAGNIGGVYDLRRRAWSPELCAALGIPLDKLPERLVGSSQIVSSLHAEGARLTGLPSGVPVCAGGVDAAVATLSAGVYQPGQHVAMIGTSMCWGFIHRDAPRQPGFVSMPYVLDPLEATYTFGGASTAGASAKWFHDQFADQHSYADLDQLASHVGAGSDGLVFLPYLMGERSPIWDANARGTLIGLSLTHTRAHLYRAVLEGVAYSLRHNIEAGVRAHYPLQADLSVVGGVAQSALWLDVIASVTGRRVRADPTGGEAAFGDAMLAALGVGLVAQADLPLWTARGAQHGQLHEPRALDSAVYDRYFEQFLGVYGDLKERFAELGAIRSGSAKSEVLA